MRLMARPLPSRPQPLPWVSRKSRTPREQQGGQDEAAGQQVPPRPGPCPRRWAEARVSAAAKVAAPPTTQPRAIFRS